MQLKNQVDDETESKIGIDIFSRGIVTKPRSKRPTNSEPELTTLPKIGINEFSRGVVTKPRSKQQTKAKTEEKMVSISMYRGNMHKVSDVPRRWPMPEHSLSIKDFKSLRDRRKRALARISLNSNPSVRNELVTDQEDVIPPERPGSSLEKKRDGFEGTVVGESDDGDHSGRVEVILKKEADDIIPHEDGKSKVGEKPVDTVNEKAEVKETFEEPNEVEKRRKEIEERLQVLYTKKHNLFQVLKQILNAEEELKQRSNVRKGLQE